MLRAGWGIYYNPPHMNLVTLLTTNPPQASRFTYDSAPANPTLSLANPSGEAGPGGAPDVTTINRDLPDHRKNQWSVDVQQELWPGTALELSYLRARTSNIDRSFLLNTPRPGPGPVNARRPNQLFNVIRYQINDLIAEYDAVTVHVRRRMSHGLQADAHYTWSRAYDMANNSGAGATTDPALTTVPRTATSRTESSPATSTSCPSTGIRGLRCSGTWPAAGRWAASPSSKPGGRSA